jgi:excisionase family DNA binding protein
VSDDVMAKLVEALRAAWREEMDAAVARALAKATHPAEYMSVGEAADLARVTAGCIRRWIREGKLAEHRAGRVLRVARADVEALLAGGRRRRGQDDEDLTPEQMARRDLGA